MISYTVNRIKQVSDLYVLKKSSQWSGRQCILLDFYHSRVIIGWYGKLILERLSVLSNLNPDDWWHDMYYSV
jgi:hypothetical protein